MEDKIVKKQIKIIDCILIFGLTILCYFIFFRHLGEFTLRLWDEARNATNALEMVKNKNIFVTYFNGVPDMWNVKPPLHIWIVAIFFKVFGVSELTLRLPSAISATLVVLAMYLFSLKVLKNRWIGLLGSLIILSSMGFSDTHIGRTGDYDALLTLFTFLASIFTFIYFQNFQKKYLYLVGIFLTLAVITKSIAGLFFIPGIILFSIFDKKIIKLLKESSFWKTLLIFILTIGLYYFCRESLNNGYIKSVLEMDLFNRFKENSGGGQGSSFWYYWDLMVSFRFQKWIYFVPISIIAFFATKEKNIKQFILYAYLLTITYFLIISQSATKQFWYDAQLYPLASLLVASFIVLFIKKIPFLLRIFPILIICFYMQRYIRTNIAYIHRPDLDKQISCIKYGYLFRDNSIDKKDFIGVHEDVCSPFQFYLESNNLNTKTIDNINQFDKILTCDEITLNEIKQKYKTDILFNKDGCVGLKIN